MANVEVRMTDGVGQTQTLRRMQTTTSMPTSVATPNSELQSLKTNRCKLFAESFSIAKS